MIIEPCERQFFWRFRMSEACKNASDIFGALKKIASSLIKWFGQLTQRHMCFGSPLQLGSHWNVLFFFWNTHTQSQSPIKQMTPLKCSVNRDACVLSESGTLTRAVSPSVTETLKPSLHTLHFWGKELLLFFWVVRNNITNIPIHCLAHI